MVSFRTLLHTLATVMMAAVALPSAAQLQLDVLPETALLPARNQTFAGSAPSLPAAGAQAFYGVPTSGSNWLGTAIQLEEPRATGTGQYTRPKFHVGVPSESMRGFLNSAGFAADKCQLPMVRARTKSSGDGDINGTLWLYARCTFH